MTLRAYLTLLRPIRTLLFATFYGWALGFNLFKTFGGQTVQEALLITCTVVGPVILGAFLLGPLHEVMHRSFSALLPGLRADFLRWHLIASSIAAVSCFIATEFLADPFPHAASAGFILAGLSAPLLNQRRSTAWGAWLGMAGYVVLIALLALPTRELVLDAGRASPWATLVAGIAFATICFLRGFSTESLRERSRSALVFYCFQTSIPLAGSGGFAVTRYMQTENGRLLAARKADRRSRDWKVAAMGNSLREWAAAIHHCRFGGTSLRQLGLGLFILGVSPLGMVGLIVFFINRADPAQPMRLAGIFTLLAPAFHPGATPELIATLLYVFAILFGLTGTASFTAPVVLAAYRLPISRLRLARSTHLETLRLNGLVAVFFAAELGALAVGTALFADQALGWSWLARPLAATLFLIPASLLLQAFIYSTAKRFWLMAVGFAVPLLVAPGIAGALASKLGAGAVQYSPVVLLDAVFTPAGASVYLAIAGLAVGLHWLALRRHFCTCDFSRPLLLVAADRSA